MKKPKINILQFRAVRATTKKFAEENKISSENKAFLGLVLSECLSLDRYDIEDSVIDGSCDCGLDAIYIDDPENKQPVVYLVQSKYYEKEEKFDRHFEGGALTKMKEAIRDFILSKNKRDRAYQNSGLQNKLNDIDKLDNPKYKIIFCSNSNYPSPQAREQFDDFIDEEDLHGYFEIEYLHLAEIAKVLAPKQKRKIDVSLSFSGKFINEDRGDTRMFLGQIMAEKIAKLREEEGEDLFDKNVRGYLSRRNEINQKIQETATGDDSPYFMYLNNGLTISCEDYTFSPTNESPTLIIKNFQIVNGGQTTNSIYEAYKTKKLKSDAHILVKVLQIKKDNLLEKIILSTNSQTRVTSRDLRSNDDIQKLIEREMKSYGYFYEARKNKYKDEKKAKERRIDAEIAAQAYYAILKKDPASAKSKKRFLFNDYYDQIFNEETRTEDLLISFKIYTKVRELNKRFRENYSFANDASLHTACMLYQAGINNPDKIKEEKGFISTYSKILDVTKEVVNERIKEEMDSYSHRRTFIDPVTIGRILEAYKDKCKKK